MTYEVFILTRNDVKILIVGAVVGGILQIACYQYLKRHPELVIKDKPKDIKPKTPRLFRLPPPGGAVIEVSGLSLKIVLNYFAKNGFWSILAGTFGGVILKKIPSKEISKILRDATPLTHSQWGKLDIPVDEPQLVCDNAFDYLIRVLMSDDIPFATKKSETFKVLVSSFDLQTTAGRLRFLFCMLALIQTLYGGVNLGNFVILMENLLEAVKKGKISRRLARILVRRLLRKNIQVDPELLEEIGM